MNSGTTDKMNSTRDNFGICPLGDSIRLQRQGLAKMATVPEERVEGTAVSASDSSSARRSGENGADIETKDNEHVVDWTVENFDTREAKVQSDVFESAGHRWFMQIFPYGKSGNGDSMGMYLTLVESEVEIHFTFCIASSMGKPFSRGTKHEFRPASRMWGFRALVARDELFREENGYVSEKGELKVSVKMRVLDPNRSYGRATNYFGSSSSTHYAPPGVTPSLGLTGLTTGISYAPYDSKKETGMVGLYNQGATCYLNSLLQMLFFIRPFRRIVYGMQTDSDKEGDAVQSLLIPMALQRLFYVLQYGKTSGSTSELTGAFGWSARESFIMHDVSELNRVLCDNLEEKLKGTDQQNALSDLFVGEILNYIKCTNVTYESTNKEPFWDLNFEVDGCKSLRDSFKLYTDDEMLDGSNKYDAGTFGKQDAKKGCKFLKFPPVLNFLLKRFTYDYNTDMYRKINDEYHFPTSINLNEWLHESVKDPPDYSYRLVGVLVHRGDVHGGHYFAFIRPYIDGGWFKFDDERVTASSENEAVDDNFGGYDVHYDRRTPRRKSAYMLVYVLESAVDEVMQEVEMPSDLLLRCEAELAALSRKNGPETKDPVSVEIQAVTFDDLKTLSNIDLFDLAKNKKKTKVFSMPIGHAKEGGLLYPTRGEVVDAVGKELNLDVSTFVLRSFHARQNSTNRPDSQWVDDDFLARRVTKETMQVFVDEIPANSLEKFSAPGTSLIFVKFYDPTVDPPTFKIITRVHVERESLLESIHDSVREWVGDACPWFWEEVAPDRIDRLPHDMSFVDAELDHGDILVVQKQFPIRDDEEERYRFPTPPDWVEHYLSRMQITFLDVNTSEELCTLSLGPKGKYEETAHLVADALVPKADWRFLRFYEYGYDHPDWNPYTAKNWGTVRDALGHPNLYKFFVERLSVPLSDLEAKVQLDVALISPQATEICNARVFMDSSETIGDVLKAVLVKFNTELSRTHGRSTPARESNSDPKEAFVPIGRDDVCLVSTVKHAISERFEDDSVILENLWKVGKLTRLSCMMYPKQTKILGPNSVLKEIVHFYLPYELYSLKYFGNSFFVRIGPEDSISEVMERIRCQLSVPEGAFKSWKLAVIPAGSSIGAPSYVDFKEEGSFLDVFDRLFEDSGVDRCLIGVEHPERRGSAYHEERSLKIHT